MVCWASHEATRPEAKFHRIAITNCSLWVRRGVNRWKRRKGFIAEGRWSWLLMCVCVLRLPLARVFCALARMCVCLRVLFFSRESIFIPLLNRNKRVHKGSLRTWTLVTHTQRRRNPTALTLACFSWGIDFHHSHTHTSHHSLTHHFLLLFLD